MKNVNTFSQNNWSYVILTAVQVCLDLIHNLGVMFIYIATLVLTTFWVQDIFDHLMDLKIKAIQERGDG